MTMSYPKASKLMKIRNIMKEITSCVSFEMYTAVPHLLELRAPVLKLRNV
jgi:hypothetical protein